MLLHLNSLTKTYQSNGRSVHALQDVCLELKGGQFCALRGKSGCGKSTLLLTAGGLLRPDRGQVLMDEQDVYTLSANERASWRAAKIGFVFQQFHLVPYLNVLDNVLAATLGAPPSPDHPGQTRARELIERFGLTPRIWHRPAQLSTGERQRTALARALLNQPKLILADEPTGNLDEENAEIVLNHLAQFATDGGAVLLVTHDTRASHLAHVSYQMAEGRIVQPQEVSESGK